MRADRLLKMLIALKSKGKMTTRQLAELAEVSERTILRDMDALTLAGIPIVSERGKAGGWRLMEHFDHGLNDINIEALKSLFIVPSDEILGALNINVSSETIREKLLSKLPEAAKLDAQQYFQKIYIDSASWRAAFDASSTAQLQLLQAALWEDKQMEISYVKHETDCSKRIISPLGLVAKGKVWYLVALNEQGEYRNFKVSRIREARLLNTVFTRPADFNLIQYWGQSTRQFIETLPIVEIHVLAHRSIIPRLSRSSKFINHIQIEQSGQSTQEDLYSTEQELDMVPVTIQFNSEQEAIEYVLGFGGWMKLIYPESFIPKIVAQAQAAIRHYKPDISS